MKTFTYRIIPHLKYMSFEIQCPLCHELHYVDIHNRKDWVKVIDYLNGKGLAQELLKSFSNETREKFISGYCPDCQLALFGLGESFDTIDYEMFNH